MPPLQAIRYSSGKLEVLDQLKLPHEFHYDEVKTCSDAFDCIKSMRVRGAPAIAIVASLGLAVELYHTHFVTTPREVAGLISGRLAYLKESRPTAVDLTNAITLLNSLVEASIQTAQDGQDVAKAFITGAEELFSKDLETNRAIAKHGADWLHEVVSRSSTSPNTLQPTLSVLTHCNTGSLATSGHGTALGIIRDLHTSGTLRHAFFTETRPYNQGSRLTAVELVEEGIPSTLITDSMAGALMATRKDRMNLVAVITGADRVVRNGDTANKIGTYSLAVLAKRHGLKFVIAAPTTSIDLRTKTGADIEIEERPGLEVTRVKGAVVKEDGKTDHARTATVATGEQTVDVWNPAFDVTPHELIDAVVTEKGVVTKSASGEFDFSGIMPARWKGVVDD